MTTSPPVSVSPRVSLFDIRPDLHPKRLGDPVVVAESLDLCYTEITHLPEDLSVDGYLDLTNTPIAVLPTKLSVGVFLNLRNTRITHLPHTLSVGGFLDVTGTRVTHLPEGLSVGGYLDLRSTSITHLPNDMTVQGWILPPDTLADCVRFGATLTEPLHLNGSGDSAHATAAMLRRLAPYPDVLRVWQSVPSGGFWIVWPGSYP